MAYAGAPLAQPQTQPGNPARARVAQGLAGMLPMPGAQRPAAQTGMAMGGQPSQQPFQQFGNMLQQRFSASPFGGFLNALQGQYGGQMGGGGQPFGTVSQQPGQVDPFNRFRSGGGFY